MPAASECKNVRRFIPSKLRARWPVDTAQNEPLKPKVNERPNLP